MSSSTTPTHLVSTSRDGDSNTALGSLFQGWTTLSVKKLSLKSNLSLPLNLSHSVLLQSDCPKLHPSAPALDLIPTGWHIPPKSGIKLQIREERDELWELNIGAGLTNQANTKNLSEMVKLLACPEALPCERWSDIGLTPFLRQWVKSRIPTQNSAPCLNIPMLKADSKGTVSPSRKRKIFQAR